MLYVGSVSQTFDSIPSTLRVEIRYYYSFGSAFKLCISAFVLSEFTGVFFIHLLLAELRHLQNQHKHKSRYSMMMNSISTEMLSQSRIPTATTSVAQISLTENCLDKSNKSGRNHSLKTNHIPVANHVNNALRVKVVPCNRSPVNGAKISALRTNAHSTNSLDQDSNSREAKNEPFHWISGKQMRIIPPGIGSVNNGQPSIGRLRRGNARSAVNIRTEEEIPDLMPSHKSARGSKQLLYFSCKECEEIAKMRQQNGRSVGHIMSERSSTSLRQMPLSDSPSTTTSDSMTPSISVTCSSFSGSEDEKLSDKLYYDHLPRKLISRSPGTRSRLTNIPSTSAFQRQISRSTGSGSNKTLQSLNPPLREEESNTTSESERRETEVSGASGIVCRCPDTYHTGMESMMIPISENLPSSSFNTPVQRPKKRTKAYQQVTSI